MTSSDLGDVGVKGGHHPIKRLDHRHLATKGGVDVSELEADVAAADNGDPARQPLEVDGFVTGEHRAAIGFDPRRHKWIGAGRHDHISCAEDPVDTTGFAQSHPLGSPKTAMPPQDCDARSLESLGQVGANRLHQLVGVISDLLPFEPHRCRVDPETGQVLIIGQFPHLATGCQQRLGRHTAAIDTGASHVPRFNDGGFKAVFCGMFGGIEAAVTGADDDDVEVEAGVAHPDCCVVAVIVARRRSSRRGTAAAATFSDSTRELWGNVTAWVQQASSSGCSPAPSVPSTRAVGSRQLSSQYGTGRIGT